MLSPRQRGWLVTLAAVAAASLTARLGWWQLDRAAQKLALQAMFARFEEVAASA